LQKILSTTSRVSLLGFCDANWAGDVDKRKSTSSFVFLLRGGAINSRSKKQASVALSTTEAEYVALSQATPEAIWLQESQNEFLQVS